MNEPGTFIIRQIRKSDYEQIWKLASEVGHGFTSFPKDPDFIKNKVERAANSFLGVEKDNPLYLLVLEDTLLNNIVGFCGIEAKIGTSSPFYNFKVSNICQVSETLDKNLSHRTLHVVNDFQGASELVSLFLSPDFRGAKRGECLSRSRFVYMSMFAERFSDDIIAEIRGVSDDAGNSPFWERVVSKFFDIDFVTADVLSATTNKQFISDLLPREIIYVDLIDGAASKVIGVPHKDSARAMEILGKEGFSYNGYVDIFDAGPLIQAKSNSVTTVRNCKKLEVTGIHNKVSELILVASCKEEFILTLAYGVCGDGEVVIDKKSSGLLGAELGDFVYVSKFEMQD